MEKGKARSALVWSIMFLIVFKMLFSYTLVNVSPFEDAGKKKVMFSAVSIEIGSLTLLQAQKREDKVFLPCLKTDKIYLLIFYWVYIAFLYLVYNKGLVDIRKRIKSLMGIYFQGSRYKGDVHLLFI